MPDVLDKIIERLQPSTLRAISKCKPDSYGIKYRVYNSVSNARQLNYRKTSEEIHREIFNLKSETQELLKYVEIFERELEAIKSLKEPCENKGNAKAYEDRIQELEVEIEKLFAVTGAVNYMDLYNDVESLYKQICEIKKKISEVTAKYQSYEDFPPNIEQGKQKISLLKEKITGLRNKRDLF